MACLDLTCVGSGCLGVVFEFVAYLDLAWVGLGFADVACMSRVDLYLGLKGFSVSFPLRYSYLLLSFSELKSILEKWLYFVFSFVWLSWLWLPPMVSNFSFLMCNNFEFSTFFISIKFRKDISLKSLSRKVHMRVHNGFGPIIATDHNWLKYIFDIIIEALKCMKKDGESKEKEEDCGDTNESCKIIVLTGKPKSTKLENFRGCWMLRYHSMYYLTSVS